MTRRRLLLTGLLALAALGGAWAWSDATGRTEPWRLRWWLAGQPQVTGVLAFTCRVPGPSEDPSGQPCALVELTGPEDLETFRSAVAARDLPWYWGVEALVDGRRVLVTPPPP